MTTFEADYFQKFNFQPEQIKQYFRAAKNDLEIAKNSDITEVIFKFSYDALIKLGITMTACQNFKAKSVLGHHAKIIEKLSQILEDYNIEIYGNKMRNIRNIDFYDGGFLITEKQADDFLEFVIKIFEKADKILGK